MEVRLAIETDVHEIVALVNLAFRVESFMVYGDRTSAPQIRTMFQTGGFWVAEDSGRMVGCVYLELRADRAYFGLLSVDPSRQREGIGQMLVGEVERRAASAGCGVMDIFAVNVRPELVPIYRRMGYAEAGTAPFPANVPTKIPCHFIKMSKTLR
jgi:N-acetylglutamate synthase-like GNAT family acetyltransferase